MIRKHTGNKALQRLLCLALALLVLAPSSMVDASDVSTKYGYTTVDNTMFRPRAGTTDYIDRLPARWAADILGTETVGGDLWYHVKTNLPTRLDRTYYGYIKSTVFRPMTKAEETLWAANPVQAPGGFVPPAPVITAAPGDPTKLSNVAVATVAGASVRQTANAAGAVIVGLLLNSRMTVLETPSDLVNGWYKVTVMTDSGPYTGYIAAAHIKVLTNAEAGAAPVTAAPAQQAGYIKIKLPGTNLRRTPGGESMLQMPVGTILPFYGTPVNSLGYQWVYVLHSGGLYGYVRGDCYTFTDDKGNPATPPVVPSTAPIVPGPVPGVPGTVSGYIKLIRGGVNLRQTAGGPSFAQLARDTVLPYYGFTQQGGYTWYYVVAAPGAGYIRSDMTVLTNSTGTGTGTPIQPPSGSALGYVVTTKSGVNLRKTPTISGQVLTQVSLNTVWPLVAAVVNNQGYNWYFVRTTNNTGYLRGDCVRQLSEAEVQAYLGGTTPGPVTPPPSGAIAGYIKTTLTSVNIRVSPSLSAQRVTQIAASGAVFPYQGTVNAGGSMWYQILYNNVPAYMLGTLAKIMTAQEVADYLKTVPAPPVPGPTATINPADLSTTAVTVMDRVLVRASGSMSARTDSILYQRGSVAKLQGPTATADGYNWYQVTAGGVTGWIRADMLRILSKTEEAALNATGDPGAPPEATYRTLRRADTGADVTRLQTELARLGFLNPAAITGIYTTETITAVRNYQQAAGLFVDGVAGPKTQHKLYGTVPEGTYTDPSGGTVTPTLYPVEKLAWTTVDTGVWPRGVTAVVTDVKTKLSFRVKRWAGGSHADGEPLTAADTAVMCKIYGVTSAQEIAEKNLWERRPVWVTVNGRSVAGSVYGVPHNYPAGDTIPDNDFYGQFCVHFVGSTTHSTVRVDAGHQAAIDYAYLNAPSRK